MDNRAETTGPAQRHSRGVGRSRGGTPPAANHDGAGHTVPPLPAGKGANAGRLRFEHTRRAGAADHRGGSDSCHGLPVPRPRSERLGTVATASLGVLE